MTASAAPPSSHRAKVLAGYLIAAALLVWVFHDVEPAALFRNVRTMEWRWVVFAIIVDIFSYVSQGLRWSLLLSPTGSLSVLKTTQAIYSGLFVNEVLPLRAGEVLRTYLVSRWLGARLSAVVPSVLAERFFDAIWLALAVGVTVLVVPLPRYLVDAEEILALVVFGATAVFAYLVIHGGSDPGGAPTAVETTSRLAKLRHSLARVGQGLHTIGRSRQIYAAFAVSGLVLFFQVLAWWYMMLAYRIPLPFWQGAAVLLIVHLGTAIPSAPSNVGTYQFFAVVGLTLFGVDKTTAAGLSVVAFLALTMPLWMIGLFALGKTGMSLQQVRRDYGVS